MIVHTIRESLNLMNNESFMWFTWQSVSVDILNVEAQLVWNELIVYPTWLRLSPLPPATASSPSPSWSSSCRPSGGTLRTPSSAGISASNPSSTGSRRRCCWGGWRGGWASARPGRGFWQFCGEHVNFVRCNKVKIQATFPGTIQLI